MKRLIASTLVFTLLLSNVCYAAMPVLAKEETVYVNLGYYGDVEQVNIYSKITTNGEKEITDYTKYESVTNLKNRSAYKEDDGKIIWDVNGERDFAYTGKVGEEYYSKIPWTFDISYQLNGVETEPKELLGKSGLVKMTLDINANKDVNEYYQNNYMLEVTGKFDMSDYLSVSSEEATIINSGNEKTLLFIVLPGQSTTMHLELGSEDFSMSGITMAIVPITGELLNQVSDIADEKKNIEDALEAMNVSADIVLSSLGGMTTGLNGVSEGITELNNGTTELHNLSNLRDEDVTKLKTILNDLMPIISNMDDDLTNLQSTYNDVADMSNELNDELKKISKDLKDLNKSLDDCQDIIERIPNDTKDIKNAISDLAKLSDNLSDAISDLSSLKNVSNGNIKSILGKIKSDLNDIAEYAESILEDDNSSDEAQIFAEGILETIKTINDTISDSNGTLNKLVSALAKILKDADNTADTLKDLKNDLNKINDMLDKKDAKVFVETFEDFNSLSNRLDKMLDITLEYNDKFLSNSGDVTKAIDNSKNMVNELKEMDNVCVSMLENTQNMLNILSGNIYGGTKKTTESLTKVNNQLVSLTSQSNTIKNSKNIIKNILDDKKGDIESKTNIFKVDKDAKVVSFGSEENEKVSEVEFLIKTPDIKKTKTDTSIDIENQEAENISFWDRVVGIFQSIFDWIGNIFK